MAYESPIDNKWARTTDNPSTNNITKRCTYEVSMRNSPNRPLSTHATQMQLTELTDKWLAVDITEKMLASAWCVHRPKLRHRCSARCCFRGTEVDRDLVQKGLFFFSMPDLRYRTDGSAGSTSVCWYIISEDSDYIGHWCVEGRHKSWLCKLEDIGKFNASI